MADVQDAVSQLLLKLELLLDELNDEFYERDQIKSLFEEFDLMKAFVAKYEGHELSGVKILAIRIRNLACSAIKIADSYLFILSTSAQASTSEVIFHTMKPTFAEILVKIRSIKEEIAALVKLRKSSAELSQPQRRTSSFNDLFEKEKLKIMEQLLGVTMRLECVPIVGMGGIGKTTLARNVYDDALVKYHFYIRGWVAISQGYQRRKVLLGLLDSLSHLGDENMTVEQLHEKLYRCLKGRRYLIVLDDLWNTNAWDDIKRSFPDDRNGSRIMITSRISDVAKYASPNNPPHQMPFLDKEQSFALLCKKIFMRDCCPDDLEDIGKKIAEKCKGLPLAIVVVAGLLSKEKTRIWWEDVAGRVSSHPATHSEQCLNILAMSYNHLPDHLRKCFLYFGIFPEDLEIPARELILLWIAEGFVTPIEGKTLEVVAGDHLDDLVSRSLILVRKQSYNGQVKSCVIHDLFRDLCLKVAREENFLHLIKQRGDNFPIYPFFRHRISIHEGIWDYVRSKPSVASTSSFLCFDLLDCRRLHYKYGFKTPFFTFLKFLLIRVLDIRSVHFFHFPEELLQLLFLKYLSLSLFNVRLPKSISNLNRLQILIIDYHKTNVALPREIWKLGELRHLHLKQGGFLMANPNKRKPETLEKLQTLYMSSEGCTKDVLELIPNLKKLGVMTSVQPPQKRMSFHNLTHLSLLESLKWVNRVGPIYNSPQLCLPHWEIFPASLKRLSLCKSHLPWKEMRIIGKLPNLEVLKLKDEAFQGPEWEPNIGEFCCLKLLVLNDMNLLHWRASSSHFPSLVHLVFSRCYFLQEIPSDIGEIATLEMIELYDPSPMSASSAKKIEYDQHSMGNDGLKICINGLTGTEIALRGLEQ